jgi:hypothetical protein
MKIQFKIIDEKNNIHLKEEMSYDLFMNMLQGKSGPGVLYDVFKKYEIKFKNDSPAFTRDENTNLPDITI